MGLGILKRTFRGPRIESMVEFHDRAPLGPCLGLVQIVEA